MLQADIAIAIGGAETIEAALLQSIPGIKDTVTELQLEAIVSNSIRRRRDRCGSSREVRTDAKPLLATKVEPHPPSSVSSPIIAPANLNRLEPLHLIPFQDIAPYQTPYVTIVDCKKSGRI